MLGWERESEKKPEIRKIDNEMNIVDCLTKPLPEQRFRALRTTMGLQVIEQMGAEQTIAVGKSKIRPTKQAENTKSKQTDS